MVELSKCIYLAVIYSLDLLAFQHNREFIFFWVGGGRVYEPLINYTLLVQPTEISNLVFCNSLLSQCLHVIKLFENFVLVR